MNLSKYTVKSDATEILKFSTVYTNISIISAVATLSCKIHLYRKYIIYLILGKYCRPDYLQFITGFLILSSSGQLVLCFNYMYYQDPRNKKYNRNYSIMNFLLHLNHISLKKICKYVCTYIQVVPSHGRFCKTYRAHPLRSQLRVSPSITGWSVVDSHGHLAGPLFFFWLLWIRPLSLSFFLSGFWPIPVFMSLMHFGFW